MSNVGSRFPRGVCVGGGGGGGRFPGTNEQHLVETKTSKRRQNRQTQRYCNRRFALRKNAYSNILKILPPKNENFQIKNSGIFHISAQNIDCGYSLEPPRRGGSNEYPQSMFLSRNKKNNVYPCKPQFYYVKVGFKGVKIIWVCFRDESWFKNYKCLKICLIIKTFNYESQRDKAYLHTCALNDNPD